MVAQINTILNNFIWGVPAMICIIGVGLYLSIRTRFIQIRRFPFALKATLGKLFEKKSAVEGAMTPFQAVCTALAAFTDELTCYSTDKGTIRIPYGKIDAELIGKIARWCNETGNHA